MPRLDKRKGKTVKQERNVNYRKSIKSIDALFEKFYNAKKAEGRAKGTLDNYEFSMKRLRQFLDEREYGDNIDELTTDMYREFINYLQDEYVKFDGHKYKPKEAQTVGLSNRSIHSTIKILRQFHAFLVAEGLDEHNPLENVKNIKYTDKEIDVMKPDEIKALMGAPDQRSYSGFRDYVLMTLLLDGMLRINEALTLRDKDVDFSANTVHIRAEITKTRKGRTIPIQKRTARLIKELREEVDVFDTELIFLANYGEPLTTNHFRTQLNRYAERIELGRKVNPHLFRHTAATMFLEAGGDIRHLQIILGHSDLRMVTRYTHISGASLASQHEQYSPINNVIGKLNKERKILR